MREYETTKYYSDDKEDIDVEALVSVSCDCCNKKELYEPGFSDIETLDISFGYLSDADGDKYSLDVCSKCILTWMATFKNKPTAIKLYDQKR